MMAGGRLIGVGTDIIECQRIADMIEKHQQLFLQRVFTPAEIEYCSKNKIAVQHYAGRWAAKEAALKAIGTGWAKGIQWIDIEILSQPGGRPVLHLHRAALEIAGQQGIRELLVSISHTQQYAVAFVSAIGKD
jgi:holo-[acyl-carrier protein] synthase